MKTMQQFLFERLAYSSTVTHKIIKTFDYNLMYGFHKRLTSAHRGSSGRSPEEFDGIIDAQDALVGQFKGEKVLLEVVLLKYDNGCFYELSLIAPGYRPYPEKFESGFDVVIRVNKC